VHPDALRLGGVPRCSRAFPPVPSTGAGRFSPEVVQVSTVADLGGHMPEELVAGAYDFAEQLLTSRRKFAENVIEATKPLLGAKEGPAAKEGDTG
jgi:hypothetical protein